MFCKYCGKDLSDDAVFCSGCGKRLVMEVEEKIAVEEKLNYEPPSVGQVTEQTIEKSDANETDVVKFDSSAKELEEVAAVSDGADKERIGHMLHLAGSLAGRAGLYVS